MDTPHIHSSPEIPQEAPSEAFILRLAELDIMRHQGAYVAESESRDEFDRLCLMLHLGEFDAFSAQVDKYSQLYGDWRGLIARNLTHHSVNAANGRQAEDPAFAAALETLRENRGLPDDFHEAYQDSCTYFAAKAANHIAMTIQPNNIVNGTQNQRDKQDAIQAAAQQTAFYTFTYASETSSAERPAA